MYIGCNALWLMSTVHLKTKTKTKVHGYQIWQSDRSTLCWSTRPNQTRGSFYFPLADLSSTCVLVLLSLLYKYKRHDRAICYIPHHPIHQLVNHQDFSRMKVTFWWFTVQFLPLKKQESEEQVDNSKFVTSVHCWPVLTHIGCKWWFIESKSKLILSKSE